MYNAPTTLLLVEDEMLIAMTERSKLEKMGYRVTIANTGEEAIALLEGTFAPDCILLDEDLGDGIDGIETASNILKTRDIPIIFLTSHSEPDFFTKIEKMRVYGCALKQGDLTALDAMIKTACGIFRIHAQSRCGTVPVKHGNGTEILLEFGNTIGRGDD